jgi:hypothetical protein
MTTLATKQSISKIKTTPKQAIIKAKLYGIDNNIFEISLTLPWFASWTEPSELAASHLENYILDLTTHWVQISHYQISVYSSDENGNLKPQFNYLKQEIPLNKVYSKGGWVNPINSPEPWKSI